jgi:tryptophan synthase alpha chain
VGDFFRPRPGGQLGLAIFLNAGDPPLPVLAELVSMLDEIQVDCLELAVPFPDSPSDGPVVRRSADRALAQGIGTEQVLAFIGACRPALRHLRVALLADWSHTIRGQPLSDFARRVADSGADGLLAHGIPPRLRPEYYKAAHGIGLPVVTTCYASSSAGMMSEAAVHATAYLYLVAQYGRSGRAPAGGYERLRAPVAALRAATRAPIAVGFGIGSRAGCAAVRDVGADAAVVGSAGIVRIERAVTAGLGVVSDFQDFIRSLRYEHAHEREN